MFSWHEGYLAISFRSSKYWLPAECILQFFHSYQCRKDNFTLGHTNSAWETYTKLWVLLGTSLSNSYRLYEKLSCFIDLWKTCNIRRTLSLFKDTCWIHSYIHTYIHTHWHIHTCLLLILMFWHRQTIFESKGDKLSSSAESRIWTRVSGTESPADWMPADKPTELEDQAKNMNSTARPYDQRAFSPLDPINCRLAFTPGSRDIHYCCSPGEFVDHLWTGLHIQPNWLCS